MIRISVDIQCDKCKRVVHQEKSVEYRVDSLMPEATKELQDIGWRFERDADWKLTGVTCWECEEKQK